MSAHEVLFGLPGAQGWAMICWAIENSEWSSAERVGLGYVGMEGERLKRLNAPARGRKH